MSKFYHVTNCNRTIKAGTHSITFVPYEHTGCWLGVYEAVDSAEIAALDELCQNPKSSVTAISQDEYNHCVKKKRAASQGYNQSLATSAPSPSEPKDALSVGETVETSPALIPVETQAPLESVKDAVEVVKVEAKKKAK